MSTKFMLCKFFLISLITLGKRCASTENTRHCVEPKFGHRNCDEQDNAEPTMALVPYNENNDVLSIFNKPERFFHFAGQDLKISQEWNKLGVAAVVWDAVSLPIVIPL